MESFHVIKKVEIVQFFAVFGLELIPSPIEKINTEYWNITSRLKFDDAKCQLQPFQHIRSRLQSWCYTILFRAKKQEMSYRF